MGTKEFNMVDKLIAWMRLRRVLSFVKKDSTLLDFGCGHQAYLLKHIQNNVKLAIGLDYDVEDEQIASHIQTRKFKFIARLPFLDMKFNTIFSLAVLEHIDLPIVSRLFKEYKRVLKNDGKIVLTTPTPRSKWFLEFLAFRLHMISEDEVGDHKKYYTKSDIEDLCQKNKLKISIYQTFWFGMNSFVVIEKK